MSAHNHTDFILPGDRNPLAILQAISAILLALDMVYNRRRLEALVHALRNMHLISLVADRYDLVVVPQMVIYYTDDPTERLSSSLSTQPEQSAHTVIPDFCVLHLPFSERDPTPGAPFTPTSILDWRRFQLESAFIPIIEEDKRPISRGQLPMSTIRASLRQSIEHGCRDAAQSARHLWRDPRRAKQKRVILISSVGLWWTFMLAKRPTVGSNADENPGSNADENPGSNADEKPGSDAEDSNSDSSHSSESWVEESHEPAHVDERADAQNGEDSDSDSDSDDDLEFILELQTDDSVYSSLKRKTTDNIEGGVGPDDNRDEKRRRTASPMRDARDVEETQAPAVPTFRSIDIVNLDPAPDAERDPNFNYLMDMVVDNVQDAWPSPGEWSGLIHMGTPASNQRLWLIHDWLQTFSTDPECVDLDP